MAFTLEHHEKETETRRKAAAREAGEDPEAQEASEPRVKQNKTFEQLKNDDVASARFMRFLEENDHEDLQKILLAGEKNPEQLDARALAALTQEKEKFLLLMERTDTVLQGFDVHEIEKLAETLPALKNVVGWGGPERIREALQRKLHDVAIQEPYLFDSLARRIENRADEEKKRADFVKDINTKFKEWDITIGPEIAKILHGDNPKEAALMVAKKMAQDQEKLDKESSLWKRMFSHGPSKKSIEEFRIKVEHDIQSFADESQSGLEDHKYRIDQFSQYIAFGLEAVLTQNKDVHDAVFAGFYGKKVEGVETMSMKDAQQAMQFDSADATAKWEERRNKARDEARAAFVEPQKARWLAEKEAEARDKHFRDLATTRLQEAGESIDEDHIAEKTQELIDNFHRLPIAKQDELHAMLREECSRIPVPPELMSQWEAGMPDITPREERFLRDDFLEDYTSTHMEEFTNSKNKKKGYISRTISGIFKGFLSDIFR